MLPSSRLHPNDQQITFHTINELPNLTWPFFYFIRRAQIDVVATEAIHPTLQTKNGSSSTLAIQLLT